MINAPLFHFGIVPWTGARRDQCAIRASIALYNPPQLLIACPPEIFMTPSKTLRFSLAVLCAAPLYLANCSSSSNSTGGNGGTSANADGGDGDGDPSAGDGDPVAGDGDDDTDAAAGDGDPVAGDGDDDTDAAVGDGDDDTDAAAGDGDSDGGDTAADSGGGGLGSACYTTSEFGDSCVEGAPGQWTEANCADPRDACPGGWYGKCTIGDDFSRSYYYVPGIGQNACNIAQGVWEEGEGP
jgi:hypothetical protein